MLVIRKKIKRCISACSFDSFLAIDRAKIDAVRIEFDAEIATTTTRFPIECAPLRQRIFLGQIGRIVVIGSAAISYNANGRETELAFLLLFTTIRIITDCKRYHLSLTIPHSRIIGIVGNGGSTIIHRQFGQTFFSLR